jgi:putative Mg2+ transporter-C (MgtC) family protein
MIDWTSIINLTTSFLLGSLIGWSREKEGKTAGMRTHVLVCLGSALFMVISMELAKATPGLDPGRLAAGVVTGIGFLGAGCIVQTGSGVRGITTAASIWITSAIGIAAGASLYPVAVVATLFTVLTLQLLREFEIRFIKTKGNNG